jgi:putative FmdB family regulatory protein
MPIYEIKCSDCDHMGEVLVVSGDEEMRCPSCGSRNTAKLMSTTSSMTGQPGQKMPGPGDTACCGSRPGEATQCAGPGSCCGQG